MKLIDISTPKYPNTFAMVDDEDFILLSAINWTPEKPKHTIYCSNFRKVKGKTVAIRMHRLIINPTKDQSVDHIDGNGLNNQKANLRVCTNSQNAQNRKHPSSKMGSQYKGVSFFKNLQRKQPGYFVARITHQKKQIFLGKFANEVEAAKAYNAGAMLYFGEFAALNEIKS